MRFRGVGQGKILEEQFVAVSWSAALAAWWADRPRRTWVVSPYNGLYGVFSDRHAAEEECRHQNDVLGPGNEWRFSRVIPGPWLRPSQMATMETYQGSGTDRKA